MNYLLIGLVVLAALLVLYLVARLVKPFGQALAFVCAVASRVFVKIEEYMSSAARYCHNAAVASLHYPPGITDRDYWNGIDVLSRLVYFALAVCILGGETVSALIVLPALLQTANHFALPGIVDITSACLFICCPALLGAVVLECWGKIPQGAGLFFRMGKLSRWVLGIIAFLLLLFSILVNGYFYLFRAQYLADPQNAQGMVAYILGGLGVEVSAVSPFALWALVVGGLGVVSLLLWLAEMGCRIVGAMASFLPHVFDVLAVHLSGGTMSVHGEYIGHDPHKVPPLAFSASRHLLPGQQVTAFLPQNTSTMVDALGQDIVVNATQEKEQLAMNLEKSASLGFYGGFGQQMFPFVAKETVELNAPGSIMSSSVIVLPVNNMQTGIPGVYNRTPSIEKRHKVALHSNTQAEAYKTHFDDDADTLIETHIGLKSVPAPMISFIGCRELIEYVSAAESIKRRYPLCRIGVITEVSEHDLQDNSVRVGLADMQTLAHEHIIENIILTDPNSDFAREHGLETQHRFLAKPIVSLVIAATHSTTNVPCPDVLNMLHRNGAFAVIHSVSKVVAVGKMPARFSWLPWVKGRIGTGNLADILAQSRIAIDEVFTKEKTAMSPVPADPGTPRVIVVNVPIRLDDDRFAVCCRENALYVSTNYPNTLCLTVRGNGCAYPHHLGSRFLVQVSCLTPVQNITSLFRAHTEPSVKVTQLRPGTLAPDPSSTNSHVPARSHQGAKRAVAPSRQKNAAPTRRVGRKNTKMA